MSEKNEFNRASGAANGGDEQGKQTLSIKRPTRRMTYREASQRTKLDIRVPEAQLKKYGFRWVNDDPGRIQHLQDLGYEIVDQPNIIDERGTERRVGRNVDGSKMNARLMRIPREFIEEDEEVRRERRKEQLDSVASKERGVTAEARREGIYAEQLSVNKL